MHDVATEKSPPLDEGVIQTLLLKHEGHEIEPPTSPGPEDLEIVSSPDVNSTRWFRFSSARVARGFLMDYVIESGQMVGGTFFGEAALQSGFRRDADTEKEQPGRGFRSVVRAVSRNRLIKSMERAIEVMDAGEIKFEKIPPMFEDEPTMFHANANCGSKGLPEIDIWCDVKCGWASDYTGNLNQSGKSAVKLKPREVEKLFRAIREKGIVPSERTNVGV